MPLCFVRQYRLFSMYMCVHGERTGDYQKAVGMGQQLIDVRVLHTCALMQLNKGTAASQTLNMWTTRCLPAYEPACLPAFPCIFSCFVLYTLSEAQLASFFHNSEHFKMVSTSTPRSRISIATRDIAG